jgi:hypothetical protein
MIKAALVAASTAARLSDEGGVGRERPPLPPPGGGPERVAMQMTGHKTRSVFERYNIVSECDLVEAAKKLNTFQPVQPASDRDGLAATKPRSTEVGHNSGTVEPDRGPRLKASL